MTKSYNSTAATQIATKTGVEPIIVIKITFASGSIYYAMDKPSIGTGTLANALPILDVSQIVNKTINFKSSNAGTVTVSLIDTDLSIKTNLGTSTGKWANAKVDVYQHFVGTTFPNDSILLYSGIIASPIQYDDVQRVLTFSIIQPTKIYQIPFAPSEDLKTSATDAHSSTDKRFYNKSWPTPFGHVLDVPAQQVTDGPRVRTISPIFNNSTFVFVEPEIIGDANPFPIGTNIDVVINGERITNCQFATSSVGDPNYWKLTLGSRNRNVPIVTPIVANRPSVGTDPDAARPDIVYVRGNANANGVVGYPQVVGNWAVIAAAPGLGNNFCIKQIGNKCYFLNAWPVLVGSTVGNGNGSPLNCTRYKPGTGVIWQHAAGSLVTQWNKNSKKYVVSDNIHTSVSDLKRVRAYRNVPVGSANSNVTSRQLVTVPPSYYEVDNADTRFQHTMADATIQRPMTIKFAVPLSERLQGWEDDTLYVTLETKQSVGASVTRPNRNTIEQIKYILLKYTKIVPNGPSFLSESTNVVDYPSDFAILDQRDAVDLCQDIAWQARCALSINGQTAKIKYLATPAVNSTTITDAQVLLDDSTILSETEFEDIVTVFVALYKDSYVSELPKRIIKRVNDVTFGEKLREFSFFIYQNRQLVNFSATYWSTLWGRIWRYLNIRGPLPLLPYDPFDRTGVNLGVTILSQGGVPTNWTGTIEETHYDSTNFLVDLKIRTPFEVGTNQISIGAFPTVSAYNPNDPFADITAPAADDLIAISPSQDGN